jgi:hypothetical protein
MKHITFYVWLADSTSRADHAVLEVVPDNEVPLIGAQVCPTCFEPVGSLGLQPQGVLEIRKETTGDWPDVQLSPSFVVSERFVKWWQSNDYVSNLKLQRITSLTKNTTCPSYYLATLPYGGPLVDLEQSVIRWSRKPKCATCHRGLLASWTSVRIRMDTWHGEDLFIPIGFSRPLVSERFAHDFQLQGLTGGIFLAAYERK